MKNLLLSLFVFLLIPTCLAQGSFSFYQLGDFVPQTQNLNPAYIPANDITISLPILNSSIQTNTGFDLGDFFVRDSDDQLRLNFQELLKVSDETNNIDVGATANLFLLQFKYKRASLSLFSNLRVESELQYTNDLIDLIANGNLESIGSNLLLQEEINLTTYNEIGIAYARSFAEEKLVFGLRLKYLNGQFYAGSSGNSSLNIYTNPEDFTLGISAENVDIKTAGIKTLTADQFDSQFPWQYAQWTNNSGFGVDLGLTYKPTKELKFGFAINDIGYINWREYIQNYKVANKTKTISGEDLLETGQPFEDILEIVDDFFKEEESFQEFRTKLNSRMYLNASYTLSEHNTFAFTAFNYSNLGRFRPSYALSYNWFSGQKITAGIITSFGGIIENPRFGLNLASNFGPVQLYAATDNFLNLIQIGSSNGGDIRFGINILLGRTNSNSKS